MSECELTGGCPFYNDRLRGDPVKIDELKNKYCRNNNLNCARYMVANAIGRDKMPPDLFPDQKDRAYGCIAEG